MPSRRIGARVGSTAELLGVTILVVAYFAFVVVDWTRTRTLHGVCEPAFS